ncbi:MAG: hypothetical protein FH749_11135 [Firmicutes bacterium]|nr:hypothetical protein [Bacillota bacterium]
MENLKLKKIALILAPILTPLSVYLLMNASAHLHHMLSFSIGYAIYWFFWCLAFPLWLLGRQGLKKMLKTSAEPFGRPALLGALLLFIPLIISPCS